MIMAHTRTTKLRLFHSAFVIGAGGPIEDEEEPIRVAGQVDGLHTSLVGGLLAVQTGDDDMRVTLTTRFHDESAADLAEPAPDGSEAWTAEFAVQCDAPLSCRDIDYEVEVPLTAEGGTFAIRITGRRDGAKLPAVLEHYENAWNDFSIDVWPIGTDDFERRYELSPAVDVVSEPEPDPIESAGRAAAELIGRDVDRLAATRAPYDGPVATFRCTGRVQSPLKHTTRGFSSDTLPIIEGCHEFGGLVPEHPRRMVVYPEGRSTTNDSPHAAPIGLAGSDEVVIVVIRRRGKPGLVIKQWIWGALVDERPREQRGRIEEEGHWFPLVDSEVRATLAPTPPEVEGQPSTSTLVTVEQTDVPEYWLPWLADYWAWVFRAIPTYRYGY